MRVLLLLGARPRRLPVPRGLLQLAAELLVAGELRDDLAARDDAVFQLGLLGCAEHGSPSKRGHLHVPARHLAQTAFAEFLSRARRRGALRSRATPSPRGTARSGRAASIRRARAGSRRRATRRG